MDKTSLSYEHSLMQN